MSLLKPSDSIRFITHEPSLIDRILQIYWIIPKSWRLAKFSVEGDTIRILNRDGKEYVGLISETQMKYVYDSYEHFCIYVSEKSNPKNKIHFREIPGVLEDDEWKSIFDFCSQAVGMKGTGLGKITGILKKVRDAVE